MKESKKKSLRYFIRFAITVAFFLIGLSFTNRYLFGTSPLFGIPFLGELAIALLFAMFGYFILPTYFIIIKDWVSEVTKRTYNRLVNDFWNQYIQRTEESRETRK